MAAIYPVDNSKPWVHNDVEYVYDANEDRWYVVSTYASDTIAGKLQENASGIIDNKDFIDAEIIKAEESRAANEISQGVQDQLITNNETNIVNLDSQTTDQETRLTELEAKVASLEFGSTPVGTIMMWLSEEIPDGWFKCTGKYFGAADYPKLAAYLENTTGNSYGYLPNFEGHYPGGLGGGIVGGLGNKLRYWTAKPTNAPKSSKTMPDGSNGTHFVESDTTGPPLTDNAYRVGKAAVTIDSGWDEVTRPNTFTVHFIIKHD